MKAEYTAEDFAKGVRNPYFHKLTKEVEVVVNNEDYEVFERIAADNGEPISETLRRCVSQIADRLREDDEINAGRLPMKEGNVVTYRG